MSACNMDYHLSTEYYGSFEVWVLYLLCSGQVSEFSKFVFKSETKIK